ncbi:MAG TPA: hypothetical protein G4O18_10875 [Dehalococcoidia bacterium]|nr:hypothetical protein [Dehalococcoidia bacterium]
MKAIQTEYKGYRFRSRTEARWAVFFDNLNWNWEYEPEGYVLPGNIPYLPDFKLILPNSTIVHAEVKNLEFDDLGDEEISKVRLLSNATNTMVVILPGTPECRIYNAVRPMMAKNSYVGVIFQDYEPYLRIADEYWLQQTIFDKTTGRVKFAFNDRQIYKAFGRQYTKALRASRSARFEYGETPQ